MHYVILRDDDTNALTPAHCLERLYRPFLDRGFPVNLAVIPNVRTTVTLPDGRPEGFLIGKEEAATETVAICSSQELVRYLAANPGYHIAQHGHHHESCEFDRADRPEIARRLDEGARLLWEAGFARPQTFVAPHDRLSPVSLAEVARRFRVLSTGWYEWRRLPPTWWPKYCARKLLGAPHWRVGRTWLLSHPGCLLSCHRDYDSMLDAVTQSIRSRRLTVLVTHWWEYFRDGQPDERFIGILHETAAYLAKQDDIQVVSFDDLAAGAVPPN